MVNKIGIRSMSTVYNLSDETAVEKFQKINDKSILYFTATWCPPCKTIKPVYESMAKQYPEIAFGKVDVDENAESASTFEVSGQ
jgi:thioredoxin 1